MAIEPVTVERLEAFHHTTRQALIYAQSLTGMNLSHAAMGIPHKNGAKRTETVYGRPLEDATGQSIAAAAFMLAENISKLDADLDAYTALRAVAFANDGSAHQNAYRFVREVIDTLHVECDFDWFGDRPSGATPEETEAAWQALGASMVPVLPKLVRRLKDVDRPDIARLNTIMGDELLKAKLRAGQTANAIAIVADPNAFVPFPLVFTDIRVDVAYTSKEQIETAIQFCADVQRIAQSRDPLPDRFIADIKQVYESSLWYNPVGCKPNEGNWQFLPKDRDTFKRAAALFELAPEMVLKVAAALGFTNCERLLTKGTEYKAAWMELEAKSATRIPNTDSPVTLSQFEEHDVEMVRKAIQEAGGPEADSKNVLALVEMQAQKKGRILRALHEAGEYNGYRNNRRG